MIGRLYFPLIALCAFLMAGSAMATPIVPALRNIALRTLIEQRFQRDGLISSDWITVRVVKGVAVLSGTVSTPLTRQWSVQLTKTVRGVRGIVDLLKVAPVHRSDTDIDDDVTAALIVDPAIARWPIRISSIDGTVTLSGTVDSAAEKRLAAQAAWGVEGVREVDNDITVSALAHRRDGEVARDIRELLRWDPWLCYEPPRVSVSHGRVTLSGPVASDFERRRAMRVADVDGVSARIDRMWIDPALAGAAATSAPPRHRPDGAIDAAVRATLAADPRLDRFMPDVIASSGTVILSGTAPDLAAGHAAREDASSVVARGDVQDFIEIAAAGRPADALLAGNVRVGLARDPLVSGDDITVTARQGEVLMRGVVATSAQRRYADDIAGRTPGVRGVIDELSVLQSRIAKQAPTRPRDIASRSG